MVDSGATHTSVVPVHEGYALRGAFVRTPLGGDYVTVQCRSFMEQQGIEIIPPYMIKSKEIVKERAAPVWVKKDLPTLTPSYVSYMNNVRMMCNVCVGGGSGGDEGFVSELI